MPDKEELERLLQDREDIDKELYEEAYTKGWNDCLKKVMEVAQR